MASHAPITGGANVRSQFPNLDPLDDISAMLEAADGACGVLAWNLGTIDNVGTDLSRTAHAIAYLIDTVRSKSCALHSQLLAYQAAQSGEGR